TPALDWKTFAGDIGREEDPAGEDIPSLEDVLRSARINVHDRYPIPPKAISFVNGGASTTFGTLGNFSLITGKAKSKKTFLMVLVLAACIGTETFQGAIRCELP